jgi:DNA-binding transcriptional MerR regulator
MEPQEGLLIGELARLAGVTPRTIRYYTSEGLLPAPTTRGKYARYSGEHLRLLRLIAGLKEEYLPLSAIRERLATMSAAEAGRLGERPGEGQPPGERPETQGARGPLARGGALPPGHRGAAGMLAERPASYGLPGTAQGEEGLRPRAGEPMAAGLADPFRPAAAPLPLGRIEFFPAAPDEAGQGPPRDAASGEELWRHFPVAPGVELRVREPLSPRRRRQIEALLAAIADKLQSEEE